VGFGSEVAVGWLFPSDGASGVAASEREDKSVREGAATAAADASEPIAMNAVPSFGRMLGLELSISYFDFCISNSLLPQANSKSMKMR
jgi:hypothetical protein